MSRAFQQIHVMIAIAALLSAARLSAQVNATGTFSGQVTDAAILTGCADCNDPITIHIEGGTRIEDGAGIIHFSVPASHWWCWRR